MNEDRDNCIVCHGSSPSTSSLEDSTISNGSSSSPDTRDDASSSTPRSSFSHSTESLYDLSELMAQLPIKRGLSKYYQGKSESFTCLSRVASIDDLRKKETPKRRKTNGSKSYHSGLDTYKLFTLPKAIISKKTPRASLSSSFPSRRISFISGNKLPTDSFAKGYEMLNFSTVMIRDCSGENGTWTWTRHESKKM